MAFYRVICALGHQSVVTVLTRCGLPLRTYFLADEKHSHCLTKKVYLPTIVSGRVLWRLGYTEDASAAVFTQSYQEFQRAAFQKEPAYRVRGILTDGFDSTVKSGRTLFPGAHRQLSPPRDQQVPRETDGHRLPGPQGLTLPVPHCCTGRASGRACGCLRSASGYAALRTTSPPWLGRPTARACGSGSTTRRRASTDTGLVPQPSNPYFRRLSMSGVKLYH